MLSEVSSKDRNGWALGRACVNDLVQSIESGRNEAFRDYLGVMARFHSYSARNVLLIAAQRPTATHLEGVRSWNELGRFVRPGEKGIFIFAPAVGFKDANPPKEEESKKPAQGRKPTPAITQPEPQLLGFRGVYVFDIAQTGGEELPDSSAPVNLSELPDKLIALAKAQQMTVSYADWIAPHKATSYRGTIRLLPDMQPAEGFPALLRELASQMLYCLKRRTFVTRALHEQETKAAAFVVCDALGLEAKASFADCRLYHGDARLLEESLHVVHRTASAILGAIRPEAGREVQS
jgi:hypothetical protein